MKPDAFKPILLHAKGLNVLIVGCGRIGKRKLKAYQSQGAHVTVVDPRPSSEVFERTQIEDELGYSYHEMTFELFIDQHFDCFMRQHLVILCTDAPSVNAYAMDICIKHAKLYNRTDARMETQFSDMLYHMDTHVVTAVSAKAESPFVSKYLLSKYLECLRAAPLQRRLKALLKATPYLKSKGIPYERIESLDDDALERIENE